MFQIKPHSKQQTQFSNFWHDHFAERKPSHKRVISASHTTAFEPHLLASSIHDACMKSFGFAGEAELTALRVCHEVEQWLIDKEEVTKADIKRRACAALRRYNPRAAYEYLPVKQNKVREDEYGFIRL